MLPRRLGPYVLEAPLGEGGMATVYRGRHTTLPLVRAVKVLASRDPDKLQRFAREASRLADFRHPNLVAIHETGAEPDGAAWFAMDLCEGETLAELVRRGPLPWERALDIVLQAARGVDALHAAGVVHRDLKPQNILVERGGRVVVIDLGLALAPDRDERLTVTGAVVGTVLYLAPEQVQGTVSPATDVHALGLILHEALTGEAAMEVGSGGAMGALARIVDGERPRPSDSRPGTPAALDRVVARAMARDPAARHARAGELADALEAVRDRPGPSAAGARLVRRAAAGAAAAGALLLAGALGLRLARREAEAPAAALGPTVAPTAGPSSAEEQAAQARLAEGEREARPLRRLPPGAARFEATGAWLARFPDHPAAAELRALRAADDAALVLAWLDHAEGKSADTYGVFVSDTAAVTAGRDATARRWLLTPDAPERAGSSGRERWREEVRLKLPAPCSALARSADRGLVLAGCRDGSISELRFDPPAVRELARTGGRVEHLALLPAGGTALFCDRARDVVGALDLADGGLRWLGQGRAAANLAIAARSGRVVVAYGDDVDTGRGGEELRAWDMTRGELLWTRPTRSRGRSLALSPDERLVAAGDMLGQVHVLPLDGGEGRTLTPLVPGQESGAGAFGVGYGITGLAWSPDGRRLYAVSDSTADGVGGLRVWDASTWREARPAVRLQRPASLDLSPDGRRLLVGTEARRVEVWSTVE